MGLFRKLFPQKNPAHWADDSIYVPKSTLFEQHLGHSHTTVLAALIGWDLGGPVDLWIYPNHCSGTIFTTMQLVVPGTTMQKKNALGMFELAGATRHKPSVPSSSTNAKIANSETPYDKQSIEIRSLLSGAARYSHHYRIEPGETVEVEADNPNDPNTCLIFDTLVGPTAGMSIDGESFGILLVISIHPTELVYARQHGSNALFDIMKAKGVYPFSDLDRDPVV